MSGYEVTQSDINTRKNKNKKSSSPPASQRSINTKIWEKEISQYNGIGKHANEERRFSE